MIAIYYNYFTLDISGRDESNRATNTELKDEYSRDVCFNCGGACASYLVTCVWNLGI